MIRLETPKKLEKGTWKCKVCGLIYNKTANKCVQCSLTRQELSQLWRCCNQKCKDINNISQEHCQTCGWHKKTTVLAEDLISREDLLLKISQITPRKNPITGYDHSVRAKAFIAMLYLTGARVSEVCQKKGIEMKALRKNSIELRDINGKPFLLFVNIPTIKRKGIEQNINPRTIPINLEKEADFAKYIIEYIDRLSENTILFPFDRMSGLMIIRRYLGKKLHPHFFRHLRTKDLVTMYGFGAYDIKQWHNHKSISSGEWYLHLNADDLAKKMA